MFNIDYTTPLSEEELNSRLDSIADQVVKRGLEVPATLFFEMHKPLSYIASQGLVVAMPMLGPFVGYQNMADFSKILANPANVERLIQRIEELSAASESAQKQE